jgi:hypothetical protein
MDWYLDCISAHGKNGSAESSPIQPPISSPARLALALDKDQSLSRTRTPHAVAPLSFVFIEGRSGIPFIHNLKLSVTFVSPATPFIWSHKFSARLLMRVIRRKSFLVLALIKRHSQKLLSMQLLGRIPPNILRKQLTYPSPLIPPFHLLIFLVQ